ncbi:hypothetical protein BN1221_02908c [Brenneria goodwinii]|uniref:Uncharacterized protein n=1 Tax=Brenneria goodwinii TaxID=1109412 RepID=A0A0G4JWX5_9GAMM|nr:hypothetical protein BN1221_02908c [Brenneria goodwinii]
MAQIIGWQEPLAYQRNNNLLKKYYLIAYLTVPCRPGNTPTPRLTK